MAGTFSQIYIHLVFAVLGRQNAITHSLEDDVYRYITGIVSAKEQKLLAINGMPDHIHIAVGIKPSCLISDLVREIKKSSTSYIRKKGVINFQWQNGYGVFSCGHTSLEKLILYIDHQKQHHMKTTFSAEYKQLLEQHAVSYQPPHLFLD